MLRKKRLVNYKNNLLIDIIEEILPNGELGWEAIAIAYQERSNEEAKQDTTNIEKHWMKNFVYWHEEGDGLDRGEQR